MVKIIFEEIFMKRIFMFAGFSLAALFANVALAYDGTHCKEPGVCWEPKPGSQYDPKHDVNELNKQAQSVKEMEARNAKRTEMFNKTGKFVYDVDEAN
jgi:methanol dehydrogenase (cytochrome c) subunit 2